MSSHQTSLDLEELNYHYIQLHPILRPFLRTKETRRALHTFTRHQISSMASWKPPQIEGRPVVVLGAGVLGRRIAAVWAAGGFNVNIRDPSAEQRSAAVHYIETTTESYDKYVEKSRGKVQALEAVEEAVKDAWLVIESVPEKLALKTATFADLDRKTPADCILCSNSSSYKSGEMIDEVSPETRKRVLNMHYMMPPDNRIVELMTDGQTHPEIFPFLVTVLHSIDMHPIVARKESSGFVFNRMWAAIKRETLTILSEGVSVPAELDSVWKEMFGSKQGPCEMMDGVGLDTVAFIEQHYIDERGLSGEKTVDYLRREFVDQGKLGAKSSKGGLYPPGYTTKTSNDPKDDHHNIHAPTLYFLDVGLAEINDPTHAGRILVGPADGSPMKTLVSNQKLPDGIDISLANNRIYWTNMGIPSANDGSIHSCKLDGSDITTIIPEGTVHTPKQLVIDHVNEKLYFCDREGLRVFRCDLDGRNLETIVQTGDWHDKASQADQTKWPVGITVDPGKGVFYWTQKGPSKAFKGRILHASMDMPAGETASSRSDIATLFAGLPEPVDLELEPESQTLYWTDRGELPLGNSLNRVKLADLQKGKTFTNGMKYEILARNLHEAIGLKLDVKNQHVYLTDLGGAVYRYNVDGGEKKVMYSGDGHAAFTGVALSYL